MKLPGEAWLEFWINTDSKEAELHQEATFRPAGLLGRMYWVLVYPLHWLVFRGMIRNLERYQPESSRMQTDVK
jgi:hypothetical protein